MEINFCSDPYNCDCFPAFSFFRQLHDQNYWKEHRCFYSLNSVIYHYRVALLFIPMATHFILKMAKGSELGIFKKLSIHNRLIQGYYLALKSQYEESGRNHIRYPCRILCCTSDQSELKCQYNKGS